MGHSIKMVDLHGQYLKIKDEIDQAIKGYLPHLHLSTGGCRFSEKLCPEVLALPVPGEQVYVIKSIIKSIYSL